MHLVNSEAGETQAQAFEAGKTPGDKKLFEDKIYIWLRRKKDPWRREAIWGQNLHLVEAGILKKKENLANTPAELTSCNELFFVFT